MDKEQNLKVVRDDILRYKKNKLSSSLALGGLVFNCLYFCLLYGLSDLYFSKITIGISVVLTLVTLLFIFLSSEAIKNYDKRYSIVLLVIAAIQIIRIFGIPLDALTHDVKEGTSVMNVSYFGINMNSQATYTMLVIWLVASAAMLIASAVTGYISATRLEAHMKSVEQGEVSMDAILTELDEYEAQQPAEEQAVKEQAEV